MTDSPAVARLRAEVLRLVHSRGLCRCADGRPANGWHGYVAGLEQRPLELFRWWLEGQAERK